MVILFFVNKIKSRVSNQIKSSLSNGLCSNVLLVYLPDYVCPGGAEL